VAHYALLRAAEHPQLDEQRPWPYLATVASNRVNDLYRRAHRDLRLGSHAGLVPRHRPFEDGAEGRADMRRVLRVLRATEDPETVSLLLGRACGITWRELAEQAGRSASAVEAQVRRARSRLRHRLGGDPDRKILPR
jgi:DNA-directed RNA polymerase specialized sigma24 family protein